MNRRIKHVEQATEYASCCSCWYGTTKRRCCECRVSMAVCRILRCTLVYRKERSVFSQESLSGPEGKGYKVSCSVGGWLLYVTFVNRICVSRHDGWRKTCTRTTLASAPRHRKGMVSKLHGGRHLIRRASGTLRGGWAKCRVKLRTAQDSVLQRLPSVYRC